MISRDDLPPLPHRHGRAKTRLSRPTQMDLPGLQESAVSKDHPSPTAQLRERVSTKYPTLRVGTSGYSFPDWVGSYYPEGTARGKMFDHYLRDFNTVEINSTYYGIPHPRVLEGMVKKTPPEFEFIIKTHSSFTHERDQVDANIAKLLDAIAPVGESGKLRGLLAQFPYGFRYAPESLDYIVEKNQRLAGIPLYVEFRHDSWLADGVKDVLAREGIGYCNVDEPALPHLMPPEAETTTTTAYVRLHGRNAAQWWGGGGERYNYQYTDDQLREWVERIDALRQKSERIFVFFNNCHLGRAVRDAHRLLELLDDSSV